MPSRLQAFAMHVIYSPDFSVIDSQEGDTVGQPHKVTFGKIARTLDCVVKPQYQWNIGSTRLLIESGKLNEQTTGARDFEPFCRLVCAAQPLRDYGG